MSGRGLATGFAVVAAVTALGYLVTSQAGAPARDAGPAGVVFGPPPEFTVVELGARDREAGARAFAVLLAGRAEPRLAAHLRTGDGELYWLAERGAGVERLSERFAGGSGTRLETVWRGPFAARIAWAREHGSFDAPGLPPGERKNLYH